MYNDIRVNIYIKNLYHHQDKTETRKAFTPTWAIYAQSSGPTWSLKKRQIQSSTSSQWYRQTATDSNQYATNGWLGRYLDLQCTEQVSTAGINFNNIDSLALKGEIPNTLTLKNPKKFRAPKNRTLISKTNNNPQLDFVLKIAQSVAEGSKEIQKAIKKSKDDVSYPKTRLAEKLKWIARLMKGNLNTKVYYTSMGGFDTHNNQLALQKRNLNELDGALNSFYKDLSQAGLMQNTSIVIFSEFGRRAYDNGNGTDHGKAAPMFIIEGSKQGKIIGNNPDLEHLDQGDIKYQIDFRSVYASILENKLQFDPRKINIKNTPLQGLF